MLVLQQPPEAAAKPRPTASWMRDVDMRHLAAMMQARIQKRPPLRWLGYATAAPAPDI
jgi:hypothetical protein